MRVWIYIPVLVVLAAIQTSMMPGVAIGAAVPNLVLCWVVGWAVIRGRGEAVPMAVFAGLVLDLLSRQPMGAHLIALVVVTFLADLGHRIMHGSTVLFLAIATLGASVAYGLILLALGGLALHPGEMRLALSEDVLPGALYNLVLMAPVFLVLRATDRRFPVSVMPDW